MKPKIHEEFNTQAQRLPTAMEAQMLCPVCKSVWSVGHNCKGKIKLHVNPLFPKGM